MRTGWDRVPACGSRRRSTSRCWLRRWLFLPIVPRADIWRPASSGDPSGRILLLLAATVGGPYLLLSATGPLLQRWFNLTEPGRSPWRLYALSNSGRFSPC